jgi:succinoglycan biosynthesis protein ExoM
VSAPVQSARTSSKSLPHICVCVCTFKRPELLVELLEGLARQVSDDSFTYSVVVADNDHAGSAKSVVADFVRQSSVSVHYCIETEQSIAKTRNKAIQNSSGDYIAFIDDDEVPITTWLRALLEACLRFNADGALGPVKPKFAEDAPEWVVKGGFYDRATYPSGTVIDWRKGRTGNVLFKRQLVVNESAPFRAEFRTGEDQDFFARKISSGHTFVWCDEAVAYEAVPPIRWRRSFLFRRSMLQGSMEPGTADFGIRDILRSLVAVPAYALALPVALIFGHHHFMRLLVKLSYHLGKLLAVVGIHPVKVAYVTE